MGIIDAPIPFCQATDGELVYFFRIESDYKRIFKNAQAHCTRTFGNMS